MYICACNKNIIISIHAAQEGCDVSASYAFVAAFCYFNPRSPRGLRLNSSSISSQISLFQSTQPKRAATKAILPYLDCKIISIHAAQEGCDSKSETRKDSLCNFNPRSPRGLRPVKARTVCGNAQNFNPRSPRGLRPLFRPIMDQVYLISIHAAQEGCDADRQEVYECL